MDVNPLMNLDEDTIDVLGDMEINVDVHDIE